MSTLTWLTSFDERCPLSAFSIRVDYWVHLGCSGFCAILNDLIRKSLTAANEVLSLCLNNNQVPFIYVFWNRFCPAFCRSTAASYQTGTQVGLFPIWAHGLGLCHWPNAMLELDVLQAFCSSLLSLPLFLCDFFDNRKDGVLSCLLSYKLSPHFCF